MTPLKQGLALDRFLKRRGVTFDGFLQFDGSHVVSGGPHDALQFDPQYLLDFATHINTARLFGWPGGTMLIDVQSHAGPNVVTNQVPAFADPDNMDAPQFTSVDRAWYQQDLWGGETQLRAGLMYVDDQFFTVPYAGNFVSLDFTSDASISTFVLPTYPKGSWGADVFVHPSRHLSFSAGIFRDHETELSYDPGGALIVSEEAWQSTWRGLPYKLQVGAWLDTGRFRRFLGGLVHHAYGVYLVASGRLWEPQGSSGRGLSLFVQFGTAPPSVAEVQRHVGAGLVWTGPLASRPNDEIGIAYSNSFLTAQDKRLSQSYESEIEAYYQIAVWRGLTVQPDLEYWEYPGGSRTPATLLGLVRIMYTL